MTTAKEKIKAQFLTEAELAEVLNVNIDRIRDLRSNHITGKAKFIDHIKPTSKQPLFKVDDVLEYLKDSKVFSFGMNSGEED